jgi:hypothetical protein
MSQDDKLMLAALELLAKRIADLPGQIAQNLGQTPEQIAARQAEPPDAPPPKLDTLGFGRDEGFGGDRLQLQGTGVGPTGPAGKGGTGDITGQNQFLTKLGGQIGGAMGKAGDKLSGGLGGMLSMLGAKFAVVLGPLAVFGQVLGNSLSGFDILGKAVKVLATTLAPILLPVMAALAAGVLAVSDLLIERLLPHMDEWFSLILTTAIPAIEFFIDTLEEAADAITEVAKFLGGLAGAERGGVTDTAMRATPVLGSVLALKDLVMGSGDEAGGAAGDGSGGDGPSDERRFMGMRWSGRGRGAEGVDRGLMDTLRSLRMSMGPKATVTGLGGVGQGIQTAAIQADPLEARMLKVQQDMLAKLERVAANTARGGRGARFDPTYGAGDYERGTGAGGGADYGEP